MPFAAIAIWAFKSKNPIHFWSGSTVRPEEITDIAAYNRANGLMWTVYAICMAVTGVLSLFSISIAAGLLIVISIPGTIVLILIYNKIYNKYRNATVTCRTEEPVSKMSKGVMVAIAAFTGIFMILIGIMLHYGSKDPVINVLDDRVQIKAMYGIEIEFSEISEVSLIEKSMDDIGVGTRTNGYGGMGETLKGNFESDDLGETLLFVQSETSPTIRIVRTDKKDVYISFHNSENTEQLYQELRSVIGLK